MTPALVLIALTGFLPDSAAVEGWTFDFHPLIHAGADASWKDGEPVLEGWEIDFSTRLSARSEIFLASVTAALASDSLQGDHVPEARVREATAEARWPGSPWVSTGIGFADRQPFSPGTGAPVVEWGWMGIDSLVGFSAGAGGVLGFSGNVSLLMCRNGGDTLVTAGIDAPWLGFGTASWTRFSRTRGDSVQEFSVFDVMADFRVVEPWIVAVDGPGEGRWGVAGKLYGWSPLRTRYGTVEIVPGAAFAGDSISLPGQAFAPGEQSLSLDLLHRCSGHMMSLYLSGHLDLADEENGGGGFGLDMVSVAGIQYRVRSGFTGSGDWNASVDADYLRSGAGGGAGIFACEDSVRLTGRAMYSPARSVTAFMELSGDAWDGERGTLDPSGLLRVSASQGMFTGSVAVEWADGQVLFRLETSGVLW
jgi:hypothetical protein